MCCVEQLKLALRISLALVCILHVNCLCWLLCSPISGRPRPAILSCFSESRKAPRIMVANVRDSETWVFLPLGAGTDCAIPVRNCWRFTGKEPLHPYPAHPFFVVRNRGKVFVTEVAGEGSLLLKFFSTSPPVVMERNDNVLQEMAKYKSNKINWKWLCCFFFWAAVIAICCDVCIRN